MPVVSVHPFTAVKTASRRRGRRRGVDVRPGSVKQARMEAGLSLGQVAQTDISRTAIYFVETGKAKPSLETLQLIAARTDKPLDYFLADASVNDDAALLEVEQLVAAGDNSGALTRSDSLIAKALDIRVREQARLYAAIALVRLGQPARARAYAMTARAYFERVGDVLLTAQALGWEAAGALMTQDPVGVTLAEEAVAKCRSLKQVPSAVEAKLLQILGTALNARHEYKRAIEVYEQAVAAGSSFPDLRGLSYVFGNLSLAYSELGQYSSAARYAHRAMAIQETLRDTLSIALSENNLAVLLHKQGDLTGAFAHAARSIKKFDGLGTEAGKSNVLMTLAELELARSRFQVATEYATAAAEVAERVGEMANAGEGHVWLARIAAAQGDDARADAEFATAFEIFDAAQAGDWQMRAHYLYGEILEARGNLAAANRQLRLALAVVAPREQVLPAAQIAIA